MESGLTEKEAANRLEKEGYNELPATKQRSVFVIAYEVAREPMFLLLVACGTLYLLLGDIKEAIILLCSVLVVMGITFYQERKSERMLEALRDLSSPRALVIRDGGQKRIAGREVVRDDIIILSEGDRVPADAVLISCVNLSVDESLLTGESVPVYKTSSDKPLQMGRPGGDNLPFVYSSTMVVKGQGVARVLATGALTEIGRIGKALQAMESRKTLLQKATRRLVRNLAIVGLSLSCVVVVVYSITRGNWLEGFLAGVTLAMATLPEELPVVLTVFLALGAWRISRKRVLTRNVPAIETLGSATVLCVDKTGTLTQNQMTVARIFADNKFYNVDYQNSELPVNFHETVEFSMLASQKEPFDPMEKAIKQVGTHYLPAIEHIHAGWTLVREYPLSQKLLALSRAWSPPGNSQTYIISAKGAPEAIAELCHLNEAQMSELAKFVSAMAADGLRVLGVAKASYQKTELPDEQHDFSFQFLGLLGLVDPLRPSIPAALKTCYSAGIRVLMITGDYPGTARSIAAHAGLMSTEAVITGAEIDNMDDLELQKGLKTTNIFARFAPDQKLRLVNALIANGEIVAMTGDGVNDAPALKAAHIGIAMGGRGTDVARESSDLVLLDDDFSSIVEAILLGRRIFDNMKKAIAYIVAIHVPIAGMSLIPVLMNWPLVLLPVHIVFLELIIDPACSIVFEAEPEEDDVMERMPRNPKEPLFSRQALGLSLLQGVIVLVTVLAVFMFSYYRGQGEQEARTLSFITLVLANLGLILTNLSWSGTIITTLRKPNAALWWVVGGAVVVLGLSLYVSFLRELFRFIVPRPIDLGVCLAASVVSTLWFEGFKLFNVKKNATIHHN